MATQPKPIRHGGPERPSMGEIADGFQYSRVHTIKPSNALYLGPDLAIGLGTTGSGDLSFLFRVPDNIVVVDGSHTGEPFSSNSTKSGEDHIVVQRDVLTSDGKVVPFVRYNIGAGQDLLYRVTVLFDGTSKAVNIQVDSKHPQNPMLLPNADNLYGGFPAGSRRIS